MPRVGWEFLSSPVARSNSEIRIAATGKPIEELVRRSEFGGDLYARLRTCTIRLPDLDDRGADIKRTQMWPDNEISVDLNNWGQNNWGQIRILKNRNNWGQIRILKNSGRLLPGAGDTELAG